MAIKMDQNHVMTIDQEVEAMNTEMQKSPKLFQEYAGKELCCIFRVPQSLRNINEEAYQPQIVSIGPYHHGNKNLEMIQEHKWRYLRGFLTRMENSGKSLNHFYNCIMLMEHEIRKSYSESMEHSKADLVKMMVLDGVFLIELFRKIGGLVSMDQDDDTIVNMVWVLPFFMRDFLRIENQIPFFVLQALFDESQTEKDVCTLPSLILRFFNYGVLRPKGVLSEYVDLKGEHLLDFFRKSFLIPGHVAHRPNLELDLSTQRIQPATKLVILGVKFKKNDEAKSFLDIKFQKGVLLIPQINLDDFYTHFILNGMIFEQCYSDSDFSKDITTYIVFLGCLINTSMDVGLLSDKKIIQNYLGTDKELVKFFNNVVKYVAFDVKDNYLLDVFKQINDYSDYALTHTLRRQLQVGLDEIKHTYFDSPWTAISAVAAVVLLCLTVVQTFYTVYPYYYDYERI